MYVDYIMYFILPPSLLLIPLVYTMLTPPPLPHFDKTVPAKCCVICSLHLAQMLSRAVAESLASTGSWSPCSRCCSTAS